MNGSLRYCINNAPSGSTITFADTLSGTIKLTEGDLVIQANKRLTLRGGSEANRITISGENLAAIHVSQGSTLNISDLSFKNSKVSVSGFFDNQGIITIKDSIISGIENTYGVDGGAIKNDGTLIIDRSTLSRNIARGDGGYASGGAINNGGNLTVIDSTIQGNQAIAPNDYSIGGAIKNWTTGTIKIINSTISGNTVISGIGATEGGGIYNAGTLTIMNSTISGNTASTPASNTNGNVYGGGIDNDGMLTVINSTISNNRAISGSGTSFGGGIENGQTGMASVTNNTISGNTASSSSTESNNNDAQGGGIDNDGQFTMINSTISGNAANNSRKMGFGGGVFFFGGKGAFALIRFCTIYNNTSDVVGGILDDPRGNSQITISNSIIAANKAPILPDIGGRVISNGYNLLTNMLKVRGLTTTDKQVTLADLKLDPTLHNNGGPTQTLKLLPESPAIDVIPQQACAITITDLSGHRITITTDQRDNPRPDGDENACDIGAYESAY